MAPPQCHTFYSQFLELRQPFGLDPTTICGDGIRVSLEAMISEAEKLAPRPNAC
jgi:hypothetical protein